MQTMHASPSCPSSGVLEGAMRAVRGVLPQVQLCSVSGEVFPREDAQQRSSLGLEHGGGPQDAYLQWLLAAVLPWIWPADAAVHRAAAGSEAELLDACRQDFPLSTMQSPALLDTWHPSSCSVANQ